MNNTTQRVETPWKEDYNHFVDYEGVPKSLKDRRQWVGFIQPLDKKDGKIRRNPDGSVKFKKIPVDVHTLRGASSTDATTWATFDEACAALGRPAEVGGHREPVAGIGFVFSVNENSLPVVTGIDIDHVIDPESHTIDPAVLDLIRSFDSYTEFSPSGTGVHIYFYANFHPEWRHKITDAFGSGTAFEIYQTGRFFTVTGNAFSEKHNLVWGGDKADALVSRLTAIADERKGRKPAPADTANHATPALSDDEIIEKAAAAKNGSTFTTLFSGNWESLYGSHSEADLALCDILAFWTGADPEKIDRIFRRSTLMRDKWDSRRGATTYGRMTIEKALASVRDTYKGKQYSLPAPADSGENAGGLTYDTICGYSCDPIGAANLFADQISGFVRYLADLKLFTIYNGTHWQDDTTESLAVGRLAMGFIEHCQSLIPNNNDPTAADYRKLMSRLTGANMRQALVNDCKKLLAAVSTEFDTQDYLINVQNGTIDLRSGELLPHRAADNLRKIADVTYDPNAVYPRFDRFIREVTNGDSDGALALQTALGYSLSGSTAEETFFIAYGKSTRNGKGTLFSAVENILGSYAATTEFDSLCRIKMRDGSRANPDIARLEGTRFVLCNEPEKGGYFNESLLKQLTGGDTIAARPLYADMVEFKPNFKLFITANNLPNVRDSSLFTSDRVRILDFPRHFAAHERDKNLKKEFLSENAKSAIFNWLLAGYKLYSERGLITAAAGRQILTDYKSENDFVSQYIKERLIIPTDGGKPRTKLTQVRNDYALWCADCGIKPMSRKSLKEELLNRNVEIYTFRNQDVATAIVRGGYGQEEKC